MPECLKVVPVVAKGKFSTALVNHAMDLLKHNGSFAVGGYYNPEGVVVFHSASGHLYKVTYEMDETGKGEN